MKKKHISPAEFDPDAPAGAGSGIYGLPFAPEDSKVVIIPVPFEATTSYGGGTSGGPEAVLAASKQVDLYDHETGRPFEKGIAMQPISRRVLRWNREARKLAKPVVEGKAGKGAAEKAIASVNQIGAKLNEWVYERASDLLDQEKLVVTLGGDHAVPFGAIRAHVERYPEMGILHLDAHADLRDSFEGFTWSHASIFHNVMTRLPVKQLVQVGIRDLGVAENEMIRNSGGRIAAFFDADLASQKEKGTAFADLADEIVASLPEEIYLSWDIDGLDPTLCPHTGTPVPGGLSWNEAIGILRAIRRSGKTIVGLDLCEVAPGDSEWDANVGARLLYKMIGYALVSQQDQEQKKEKKSPATGRR